MFATISTALADDHARTLRAQATAGRRARQARQARKERRAQGTVRHEITARRRPAAARHA
jgi:hypothetical protein